MSSHLAGAKRIKLMKGSEIRSPVSTASTDQYSTLASAGEGSVWNADGEQPSASSHHQLGSCSCVLMCPLQPGATEPRGLAEPLLPAAACVQGMAQRW